LTLAILRPRHKDYLLGWERVRLFWIFNLTARDGNIRYYEFDNDEFWPLSEYKSSEPQRGLAFMPKRSLSVSPSMSTRISFHQVHENEVMRAYKSVRDVLVEPITFIVPRRVPSLTLHPLTLLV
jgi:hypothetical protein